MTKSKGSAPLTQLSAGDVSRRSLLGYATAAGVTTMAGAGIGPQAKAIRAAVDAGTETPWLEASHIELLSELCEAILPRTSTPGARDAKVPEFIDLSLSLAPADEQLGFLGGLSWMDQEARRRGGSSYIGLSSAERLALLEDISDVHEDAPAGLEVGAAFFTDLKSRTLFAFFTSVPGRTEVLGRPDRVEREKWLGCQHDAHA